jgi:hypothetical protein
MAGPMLRVMVRHYHNASDFRSDIQLHGIEPSGELLPWGNYLYEETKDASAGWGAKIVIAELIFVLDIYQLIFLSTRLHCICHSTFFAPNYGFFRHLSLY